MTCCSKMIGAVTTVCALSFVNLRGEEVAASALCTIDDVLQDVVRRIDSGRSVDDKELNRINRMVAPLTNETERVKLRDAFERHLFSISVANRDFHHQVTLVQEVWLLARRIWGSPPGGTEKEWWMMNFKALAWARRQISYIETSEPEDKRTWPQKWSNVEIPANSVHKQWDEARRRVTVAYCGFIKRCAQDVEKDQYTEEFKKWCKENIEKAIGRPLTDDDLIFKDDVLRRRKAREKKQSQETVPRARQPTTSP